MGEPLLLRGCKRAAMAMYPMTDLQYQAVHGVLSFALASMMATTLYLWFRMFAVKDQYQSAVCISGLVTFIAAYHYIRIFNSWVEAYSYSVDKKDPALTGVPFNDAYRYMDWLLTVPLLLIEILLVMKLDDKTYSSKAWTLGVGSALMIVSGYYGELVVAGDLTPRWLCWALSMCFFLYIVRASRWPFGCHELRSQPRNQRQNPNCSSDDRNQLVHIPCRVFVPHARHQCRDGGCFHSNRLLRL